MSSVLFHEDPIKRCFVDNYDDDDVIVVVFFFSFEKHSAPNYRILLLIFFSMISDGMDTFRD